MDYCLHAHKLGIKGEAVYLQTAFVKKFADLFINRSTISWDFNQEKRKSKKFFSLDYSTFDLFFATLTAYVVFYELIFSPASYCTYCDSVDNVGKGYRDFVLPMTKAPLASFGI